MRDLLARLEAATEQYQREKEAMRRERVKLEAATAAALVVLLEPEIAATGKPKRDSGSLEQDADMVMFIHRPDSYQPDPRHAGLPDITIAKQRNGPTGAVQLRRSKQGRRFSNQGYV